MSSTLLLANALDSLERPGLEQLLADRPLRKAAHDALELAEMLLQSDSVEQAVSRLETGQALTLLRLSQGAPPPEEFVEGLAHLGLIGRENNEVVSLREVETVLKRTLKNRNLTETDLEAKLAAIHNSSSTDGETSRSAEAHWYAPALTLTQHTAAILRWLRDTPGKVGRRGDIAASTVKALEASLAVEREDTFRDLELLRAGKLIASTELQTLRTTDDGLEWLTLPHEERWAALAKTLIEFTPAPLLTLFERFAGNVHAAVDYAGEHFPLLAHSEHEAIARASADYARFGLTEAGILTGAAHALITGDTQRATQLAGTAFPANVDGVYVQPDLSIVVPGPLAPNDEADLWTIASVEQYGLASTLRLSEASLVHATEQGREPEQIRSVIERLSLTGIPQPLNYLLTNLGEQRSTVSVAPYAGPGARTTITSTNPSMLKQLEIDRRLQHLRLRSAEGYEGQLFSQLSPEHVLSTLRDARYSTNPLTNGHSQDPRSTCFEPSPLQKRRTVEEETASETVEQLLDSGASEDLPRMLELAIREHTKLRITAEAAGRTYKFTLLPLALAGGRLRASDQSAQVERTLPLSSIVTVEPVR
ncbi:MAG: helicase-associated domain-containing protein [Canibacter sp.]